MPGEMGGGVSWGFGGGGRREGADYRRIGLSRVLAVRGA